VSVLLVLTAHVEKPAEVIRRGWLTWETVGAVVAPTAARDAATDREKA